MSSPSSGKGIRCQHCGGTFPLATLAAGVCCPYCGTAQSMTSTAIDEARRYRSEFFSQMRAADAERDQAAMWSRWRDHARGSQLGLVLVLGVSVLPCLLAVPSWLLASSGVTLPPALSGVASAATSICPLVLVVTVMLAWGLRQTRASRPPSPTEPGRAHPLACPHCGAPNEVAPGQHVATCAHCHGALMPSRTAMLAGLDDARAAHRRALLARYRAEREGMLGVARTTGSYAKIAPLFYVVPLAPMLLGVCALPLAGGRFDPLDLVVVGAPLLLIAGVVLGAAAFVFVRWRERTATYERALADLAYQFNGRATRELADFVGWLNTLWAGPYDVRFVGAGPRFGAVLGDAWGFPAAIVLDPAPPLMQQTTTGPRHARILVAAWIPGRSEGGGPPPLDPSAQRTMAWMQASGFFVSCEEAGILAMARDEVVDRLRREPAAVHQLAPVLGHLVRLAVEIGAQPVGA